MMEFQEDYHGLRVGSLVHCTDHFHALVFPDVSWKLLLVIVAASLFKNDISLMLGLGTTSWTCSG